MNKGYDHIVIYVVLTLLVVGWIMIYSSSAVMADITYNDSFKFLKKQLLFSFIGLIGMVGAMKVNYRRLSTWTYPILILSILLLIVVLIPGLGLSLRVGVARRWLMTPWFATSIPNRTISSSILEYGKLTQPVASVIRGMSSSL